MVEIIIKILNRFSTLQRRLILIFIDILIIISITHNKFLFNSNYFNFGFYGFLVIFIMLIIYLISGHYQGITKFEGNQIIYKISYRVLFSLLIYGLITKIFFNSNIRIQEIFLAWASITILTVIYKLIFRDILINLNNFRKTKSINCLIYGAGSSGAQFTKYMELNNRYKIIGFIDDNPKLWGRKINEFKIYNPDYISKLSFKTDKVFIAIDSVSKKRKKEIFNICNSFDIEVLQIPSINEISSGKILLNKLKPIVIEDLLGREVAPINNTLDKNKIQNQTICVTGGGGSIGSELCQQIIKMNPKKIIVIENSEHKLFEIKNRLELSKIKCLFFLGDVTRKSFVEKVFKENKIDILFHAAAYKHVPLVEINPLQGIFNNVFSTLEICKASELNGVKQILLISTDKAVRPTNVMGASKRVAELIIQAFSQKSSFTTYSMVRFGNVLGSSGSVVPTFQAQINSGGPITVTHPDILRYFMTISEAVQLVIQSIEFAHGGDLFLLDMGNPIPIRELANQMIYLSGLKPLDKDNPDGDIEIKYTGLRPGEKLYEELLIHAESLPTDNKYIYRANEKNIPYEFLIPRLDELEKLIKKNKSSEVFKLLSEFVPEWDKDNLK